MTEQEKLEKFALDALEKNANNLILEHQGQIVAFGAYNISRSARGYSVEKRGVPCADFGFRSSALSWCIADNVARYDLCLRIKVLDESKTALTNDINCRQSLRDRSRDTKFRDMVTDKLTMKKQNLAAVDNQLQKCLATAKYIQFRGFKNETARTRRK